MAKFNYRPEIDGLRALAVLAVIGSHLGVSSMEGGFIGVDVFFVISGYLITALLTSEYRSQGSVSFLSFFWRRIRRLLPAVLATVILTLVVGYALLSDERLVSTVWSSISAVFSVSNIYFWSNVGYFDAEAISKPLLHTWSLGVEEQFYLFWPFFLVFLLRLKSDLRIFLAILSVATVSFALNAAFFESDFVSLISPETGIAANFRDSAASTFYLFPFRVFEFGIGALLVFLPRQIREPKGVWSNLASALGLSILFGYIIFLTEKDLFPYYNALAVSIATALVIYSGKNSFLSGGILSNSILRFIGKISYSLYLVHWPLIAYFQILGGDLGLWVNQAALLIATFAVGYLLHVTVENPLRNADVLKRAPRTAVEYMSRISLPASMFLIALFAYQLKDIEGRVPEHRKTLSNADWRVLRRLNYCSDELPSFPKTMFTCQNDRKSSHTIVVWGDSHGLHLAAGLSEVFPEYNIAIAYYMGCTPHSGFMGFVRQYPRRDQTEACVKRNKDFLKWAESFEGEATVLITSAKRNTPELVAPILNGHVEKLQSLGYKTYVLADFMSPGVEMGQCRAVPDIILSDSLLARVCRPNSSRVSRELAYNAKLESLLNSFIPVRHAQCPNDTCDFLDDKGRVTHRDTHHLSTIGAVYEMGRLEGLFAERIPHLIAQAKINESESF